MELNFIDYIYIYKINKKLKKENARYKKLAETKKKYTSLPQGYLTINK